MRSVVVPASTRLKGIRSERRLMATVALNLAHRLPRLRPGRAAARPQALALQNGMGTATWTSREPGAGIPVSVGTMLRCYAALTLLIAATHLQQPAIVNTMLMQY